MTSLDKHEEILRLKKPGSNDIWRFPKSQDWKNIAKILDFLFWAESKSITMSLKSLKLNFFDLISSRNTVYQKRSDPEYMISCLLFLGLIRLGESSLEQYKIIKITLLGKIYISLRKSLSIDIKKQNKFFSEERLLVQFSHFLMFWNADFGCGASITSKALEGVHPIRCLLKSLIDKGELTFEEICTKFYGTKDDQDFLSSKRIPIPSSSPFVLWEYPYAMMKTSKLVIGGNVFGLRHHSPKDYRPDSVVKPAKYLSDFVKNRKNWEEKLTEWWLSESANSRPEFDYSLLLSSQSDLPFYANSIEQSLQLKERQARIVERTYQKNFRDALMSEYGQTCMVCGTGEMTILEAAHIIPVSEIYEKYKKQKERKILEAVSNPMNGIILCANHHKALDAGVLKIVKSVVKNETSVASYEWSLKSEDEILQGSIKNKSFEAKKNERIEFIERKKTVF